MANQEIDDFTALAEGPAVGDLFALVDASDTTDSAQGTTKKNEARYAIGRAVNAQTGTSYTVLATDFRKLVTHTNGSAIAVTLPQASATFPAGWFYFVQNRGAGAVTITPTTSTIDGAATLVLNQNEGALIVSDGTNYFTMRGKPTVSAGEVGYLDIPQNSQSADYTAVIGDRGKHIYHTGGDNNPRTFTIPANGSVAFPVGTALTFINKINVITIAITTDTLTWAEDGTTGSRTLAANSIATAIKITSTEWMISGTVGLT